MYVRLGKNVKPILYALLLLGLLIPFIMLSGSHLTEEGTGILPEVDQQAGSGIQFIFIPGGTFQMGDLWGDGYSEDETPVHVVSLSPYWMSQYEVTNAQYCVFLNEVGNKTEHGVSWIDIHDRNCLIYFEKGKFVPKRGYGNHPVVEVTWFGSKAYAEWIGGRLPTEAEWEYAARSMGKRIKYPNGQRLTRSYANFSGIGEKDQWRKTSPVGSFTPNGLGLYDMAGNVWERCNDWYSRNYYKISPQKDPKGPDLGLYHVIRGGSWEYSRRTCKTTIRGMYISDDSTGDIGFRVVRDIN